MIHFDLSFPPISDGLISPCGYGQLSPEEEEDHGQSSPEWNLESTHLSGTMASSQVRANHGSPQVRVSHDLTK